MTARDVGVYLMLATAIFNLGGVYYAWRQLIPQMKRLHELAFEHERRLARLEGHASGAHQLYREEL